MNTRISLFLMLAAVSLAANQVQADSLVDGSVDEGKAKAITCTVCHGAEGNSANPLWPNIAGQHASYIQAQLHAFKSGKRKDPLMAPQAYLSRYESLRGPDGEPGLRQQIEELLADRPLRLLKLSAVYDGGGAGLGDQLPELTLQELADRYGVSAERIRQLEANALRKMRASMTA